MQVRWTMVLLGRSINSVHKYKSVITIFMVATRASRCWVKGTSVYLNTQKRRACRFLYMCSVQARGGGRFHKLASRR